MKTPTEKTKVVFRKFKDGEILALFPYEPDTANFCTSYMHIGQHSGADYSGCIKRTKPANEAEYNALKEELTSIGYNLTVIKRRVKNG